MLEKSLGLAKPSSWDVYFPGESYQTDDYRAQLVQQLVAYLSTDAGLHHLAKLTPVYPDGYELPLSYQHLKDGSNIPELQMALENQPRVALACISVAFAEVAFGCHSAWLAARHKTHPLTPGPLLLQPIDCEGDFRYTVKQSCKANLVGKLVSVTGTVVRQTPIRSLITSVEYICSKCGLSQRVAFTDKRVRPPTTCSTGRCKNPMFAPDTASAEGVDWQKIRIQEVSGDRGVMPKGIDVELRGSLTDRCAVGDVVTVVGMVDTVPEGNGPKKQAVSGVSWNYIDALSITNPTRPPKHTGRQRPRSKYRCPRVHQQQGQSTSTNNATAGPPLPTFTTNQLTFIATFTQKFTGQQLQFLVQSLCPCIYGQELVKMGLLLALLGGVPKRGANGSIPLRGDIHLLLVGDPGMGKSQMLKAACDASPRGVYVCGNGTTAAGLTVSTKRDPDTGMTMFEAGAVVLADGGVCCVDEFDKISSEHQALLGAMEQQEVTIAKAGLVASLPARAGVLAAANPAGGHYHRGRTVGENLKMSSALLSRFDLIFIMVDKPDEALDAQLSEHVMALHSGLQSRLQASNRRLLESSNPLPRLQHPNAPGSAPPPRPPLLQRLRDRGSTESTPLPTELLRVYIEYARAYCKPTLTDEAKAVLQAFYVQLRTAAVGTEGIPITTRQLESMVRLAEARARVELRTQVTQQDAEDVIELMRESLYDLYLDDRGVVDFRRAGGKSKQAEAKRFLGALARRAEELHNDGLFPVEELYSLADALELQVNSMHEFIQQLNDAGELLKKGPSLFQLRCCTGGTQFATQAGSQGFRGGGSRWR